MKEYKIMIIGNYQPAYNTRGIAEGFEAEGVKVVKVSADPCPPNEVGYPCDFYCLKMVCDLLPIS